MRDKYGYGSVTTIKFEETKTKAGRERIKTIYKIFEGCDDEKVIKKFSWDDEDAFDSKEEYLKCLAESAGLIRISNEPFELKWEDEYSFWLSVYTYYDTPEVLWRELASCFRYLTVSGDVIRKFQTQDGDDREVICPLIISKGKYYYRVACPASNEEEAFVDSIREEE